MTFGMRVRLWARQAPRSHLVGTAVAVVLVAGLLATSAVPAGDDSDDIAATASVPASGLGAPTTIAGDDPTSSVTVAGGVPAPATGGGAAAPGGGRTGAQPGGAPAAGAATGASSATGDAPASSEPLTASDVGVTPETIKIGFLIAQVGGLDAAGFALGLRGDIEDVIRAYVDDLNRRGGIHGRRVVYVTQKVDPLSQSNQRAACLRMTEDEKVFAVLDSATTLGAAELCYGKEHKTPYFNTGLSTISTSYVQQSYPYQVSTYAEGTRQVINWARYVHDDGGFEGHKLGILSDECAPAPEIIDEGLKPVLAEFGIKPVDVRLSCDANTAQQQIPNAVLQMRREGVTLVFPATIFTNVQVFLQNAEAQAWRPKYSASDYYGMSVDLFVKNFPPNQWNGTRAVTATHAGEPAAGIDFPQVTKDCNAVIEGAGLTPMDDYDEDAEAIVHCDSVRLFAMAAAGAGRNPTRLGWAEAVQRIGEFPSALSARVVYGPNKTTGGDALALIEWHADCTCNVQIRPHDRPAYA